MAATTASTSMVMACTLALSLCPQMSVVKILSHSLIARISNSRVAELIIIKEQPKPQTTKTISSKMEKEQKTQQISTTGNSALLSTAANSGGNVGSPSIVYENTGSLSNIDWIHHNRAFITGFR